MLCGNESIYYTFRCFQTHESIQRVLVLTEPYWDESRDRSFNHQLVFPQDFDLSGRMFVYFQQLVLAVARLRSHFYKKNSELRSGAGDISVAPVRMSV
ncbi:hypothetical protein [Nostoc sp.]|uniref:hypothetical protein n=1 Tax=Nostoc sp. TaxID=1180 RepID=UPI002FF9FEEC